MSNDQASLPHRNALTLRKAQERTRFWRNAIAPLYGPDVCDQPHGFVVKMKDLQELVHLGKKLGREIDGVRVYLTFNKEQVVDPRHNHPRHYPDTIRGIFVPVIKGTAGAGPGQEEEATYYMDLIVPLAPGDGEDPNDGTPVSIYDVTQPCPPLCDLNSDLYKDPA